MLKEKDERKLTSFTMYQFRDEGRLGLEVSDPNNRAIGIRQPLYDVYKKILHDDYFKPGLELGKELALTKTNSFKNQVKLRWGGAEDAEGIALRLKLEKTLSKKAKGESTYSTVDSIMPQFDNKVDPVWYRMEVDDVISPNDEKCNYICFYSIPQFPSIITLYLRT